MNEQMINKAVNQITKNQILIDLKVNEAKLKCLEDAVEIKDINKTLQLMMLRSTIAELKFMLELYK